MQRVTGLDEMYLSLDTGRTVGHVAGIVLLDPPTEAGRPAASGRSAPGDLDFLRRRVAQRLSRLPLLRWRVRAIPGGIDQRRWCEVPTVDLVHHVTGSTLPAPGTEAELHPLLDRIMAEPLPRDRPLWRIHVVDGFADGRIAYVVKIHHGLADGAALWSLIDLLSDSPSETVAPAPHDPEPRLGTLELLARGALGWWTTPARVGLVQARAAWWVAERLLRDGPALLPATLARAIPGELAAPVARWARRYAGDAEAPEITPLVPTLRPPRTPFGGMVTTELGMAYAELPVEQLRRVGRSVGGTVNDAILAVTAGALRAYLEGHGGIPQRPLVASAPISWRTGSERERWANHVFMLLLPLPTQLADGHERLRAARDAARSAKATWEGLPMHLLRPASATMPTMQMAPSSWLMARMPPSWIPALYNVAVSNVRGPTVRPLFDGRPVGRYVVYGFLPPGIGLLIGGQSLGDRIALSVTAARGVVPDFAHLPGLLRAELDALLEAVPAPVRLAPAGSVSPAPARRARG